MRTLCVMLLCWGCGEQAQPRLEAETNDADVGVEAPAEPPSPATPPARVPPGRVSPLPAPSPPDLPDDAACEAPREARVEADRAGDPDGDAITEHLDAAGCVAVRYRKRMAGRTTVTITEVPGDPGWFPHPAAYVDLTPRPRTDSVTVDRRGREIERTEDHGSDGSIELHERRVWDGELLLERVIEGDRDWRVRWTYDDAGNAVRVEDITEGVVRLTEREFDERGRATLERTSVDGEIRSVRTQIFDGERPLETRIETGARVELTRWFYRVDGSLERREWSRSQGAATRTLEHHDFTTNAAGQVVEHYRLDERGDGSIDSQRWTTRDDRGRQTLVEFDRDGDGTVDWTRAQRWDAQDRMVWWRNQENGRTILLREWDFDGDEWLESRQFPAVEGLGTLVRQRRVEGGIEVVDTFIEGAGAAFLSTTRTRYHTPELLAEQTTDRGGDGTIDETVSLQVDADDRVVRYQRTNEAGTVWRSTAYDHTGQVAEERGTQVPDGPAVLLRQFIRDAAGRVVFQHEARGEIAHRAVVDYLD